MSKKYLRSQAWIIPVLFACCIICDPEFGWSRTTSPCIANREHELGEYVEIGKDPRALENPMFMEVPLGFKITNQVDQLIVAKPTIQRVAPSDDAGVVAGLRPFYKILSICIVQGPNERLWAVERFSRGLLGYVPREALETPDEYEEALKKFAEEHLSPRARANIGR